MQASGIAEVRIVGGHPALDLVNTVGFRRGKVGRDYLTSYEDLLVWATRQGLLDEAEAAALRGAARVDTQAAAAALSRARQLRECLWRIWTGAQDGTGPGEADLMLLAADVTLGQQARAPEWTGGGLAWRWTDHAGLDAVTARVALEAAELLAGEGLHRVRECEGRHCGWLFLDATRNRSRRWCIAEECGSLARVTRFRVRRKAAGTAG